MGEKIEVTLRRDAQDLAILESRAEDLNREAGDVLSYQVDVWGAEACSASRASRGKRLWGVRGVRVGVRVGPS